MRAASRISSEEGWGNEKLTSSEADWTVVTVTYNNRGTLERCWGATDLSSIRWIVVDNGSRDGSAELARELGADVIPLDANLGFSKANNVGLKAVASQYTAFVNPDVMLVPGDLPKLGQLSSERKALVAPQLKNLDQTKQPNGRGLPFLTDKFAHRGIRLPGADLDRYIPEIDVNANVAWLIGAVLVADTEIFRSLGGWDEKFFLYHEDSSLCLAAWERGYSVILSADQEWVHEWKRDSKSFRWRPVLHEAVSAWKFYTRYPNLITPRLGKLTPALKHAQDMTGKPIEFHHQDEVGMRERES